MNSYWFFLVPSCLAIFLRFICFNPRRLHRLFNETRMIACERKGTRPTRPARSNFLCVQNLKPHDDESEDKGNNSEFDAFTEKLDSNWCDIIAYDWFLSISSVHWKILLLKKIARANEPTCTISSARLIYPLKGLFTDSISLYKPYYFLSFTVLLHTRSLSLPLWVAFLLLLLLKIHLIHFINSLKLMAV